jgi:hypothetical protein
MQNVYIPFRLCFATAYPIVAHGWLPAQYDRIFVVNVFLVPLILKKCLLHICHISIKMR